MQIPETFKKYPQFINYDRNKRPYDPVTGSFIDYLDPCNQLTFQNAHHRATLYNSGIGFVITDTDPFFFLDIDHAFENGQWSELSTVLCEYFMGCYFEISMSMTGCHIIGSLSKEFDHSCKNTLYGLEFYTSKRFVALTGHHANGDPATIADENVEWLINNYFQPSTTNDINDWSDGPCSEWHGPENDEILIEKFLKSKSATSVFGGTASIADLWGKNIEVLSIAYPHEKKEFDYSSADQALLSHLAFWTGKDCARMERLFSLSGLVRDKWTNRQDYRQRSILNACSQCRNVYGGGVKLITADSPAEDTELIGVERENSGIFQLLSVSQLPEYFKGCCHVLDVNKILIPNGMLLKKDQFNARYNGWVFGLSGDGESTTKDAWNAFTANQGVNFPKVDHMIFNPRKPKNHIHTDELGRRWVNVYVPANVQSVSGDVTRVLRHIELMIPNVQDRGILLAYAAAVVQYPGYKFHWCPVIQGTYGNGKSLIAHCIAEAVGGQYSHFPEAQEIHEKFNDWLLRKIFVNIEEMSVSENKFQIMHKMKTMVDSEKLEIRQMQSGKMMYRICANFMMQSNHKDAVIKTKDDRRYAPIYTAQQNYEDVLNAGFGGNYFPDLYSWLKGTGKYDGEIPGYAHMTHFLKTYPIPLELNPAVDAGGLCHRAPVTTSTVDAIRYSYGKAEQEVIAAIDEGQQGFMGGWVSSIQLSKLFDAKRINKPRNRRADMLEELGYYPHPALSRGRASNKNILDDGKPCLYITKDNPAWILTDGVEITKAYLEAQGIREL